MKFENTRVYGFESAIRGMRNPKESWDRSDSRTYIADPIEVGAKNMCESIDERSAIYFELGENDKTLAQKLVAAGSEHRKFLRQIFVSVDITASLYWWKEASTYKVGVTMNSTSTMHKLATTPITLERFETDDYEPNLELAGFHRSSDTMDDFVHHLISYLETLRQKYLETKDVRYWKELIRWLPESWLQMRTVTMNYENIRSMVHQRANHKLTEWRNSFMSWANTLPYANELIFYEGDAPNGH